MAKYPQWEYDLLRYLGTPAPLTNDGMDAQFPNSLLALNLWAQSEGSVTNNALATSGQGPGATTCVAQCGSSSPIYEYDNVADGVAQMGRFLQGSFYTKIVSSLVGNADLGTIFNAINSSPWCKGCQGGQYPEALAAAAGGKSPGVSSTVGTGGTAGTAGGGGASASASDLSQCVFQLPGFLFFSGPCFLTKGGVKWLSGAAALVAGSVVGAFGVILLAASVFDASGAKQSVTKVAGALPGPAGKIVRGTGSAGAGSAAGRSSPARSAPNPQAKLLEQERQSRSADEGEMQFQQAQADIGPIGPRGGNRTSQRIAREQRRGVSVPGARTPARRQPSQAERRRRASQPF